MKKTARYRRLAEIIEGKIGCGVFNAGATLPSIRRVMAQTGFSLNTVRKAYALLREKGVLETVQGRGTHVSKSTVGESHGRITVVSVDFGTLLTHSLTALAFAGVRTAAKEAHLSISRKILMADACSETALSHAVRNSDGLILLGGYDAFMRDMKLSLPAVGVGLHDSYGGRMSIIDLDPVCAAEMACAYFMRKNIRKLILVSHDRMNFEFRKKIFQDSWIACGGSIAAEYTGHTELEELRNDTGILYFSGGDAVADAEFILSAGEKKTYPVGNILCMDGKPLFGRDIGMQLPTLALNWFDAGKLAIDELCRRIAAPETSSRRIYLPPKLYNEDIFP